MDIQSVKQRFGIIGNSDALNNALGVALRVASTNLSVLITGESGAGKEFFSQIIHQYSARKHNNFIAVNCGAIPEGTIDSELFGHEKGAFTGAHDTRKGYFETVNGGTIFLDEVSEMPLGTQARLLRVLESGEFIKVGSSKVQKTDVRVIAATNVGLPGRIQNGKFREDLFYRLSTVPIKVPALRERTEDIPLLFRKFCVDYADKYRTSPIRLSEEAQLLLVKYSWPGNVRELKNIAEQISVLSEEKMISGEQFIQFIPDVNKSNLPVLASEAAKENGGKGNDFTERELLYKFLFDMKKDLNDLKQFVFQMASSGEVPPETSFPPTLFKQHEIHGFDRPETQPEMPNQTASGEPKPIVIETPVEENLSLADKEKEMIEKALSKHKGKRRSAALELGISERTLYRKIKEYNISE